jgi:hypothetical protein
MTCSSLLPAKLRKMFRQPFSNPNANPSPTSAPHTPEFVLFGDSLTEWSFDDETRGFGWFLEWQYAGKARIVNEGSYIVSDSWV